MLPITLTIAGSDSGGGAGIQADLKTFQELKTFGTSVLTAVTAQNTYGVQAVHALPEDFIVEQLQSIQTDFNVNALKTGMLFSASIIEAVSKQLENVQAPIIVDPVMIAKGGATLLQQEAVDAMITHLFPLATVLTPNIPEAETLTGMKIQTYDDVEQVAKKLLAMGPEVIVMKGGHFAPEQQAAIDHIFFKNGDKLTISAPRVQTKDTHGTGCTYSAALTAFLAKGLPMKEALIEAKRFIHAAISHGLGIGHGHGPTNHFAYNTKAKVEVEIIE